MRSKILVLFVAATVVSFSAALAADSVVAVYPTKVDLSPPLRDLPAAAVVAAGMEREVNPLGAIPRPAPEQGRAMSPDQALQDFFTLPDSPSATPAPSVDFAGMGNTFGVLPPDTTGHVGPNHFVQAVNLGFAVYSKTGVLAGGFPKLVNTIWAGFGGDCQTHNDGDPILLHDQLADRWLISQFAVTYPGTSFFQCIAVSQTADPTGSWHRYAYQWTTSAPHKLNDYPHFGIWPNGYYMTVNQFFGDGSGWAGAGVAVFDRVQMLSGGAAVMIKYDVGAVTLNYGGMLPSDLDGSRLPGAGVPAFAAEWDNAGWIGDPVDTLRLWRIVPNFAIPANSTFGANASFDANHLLTPTNAAWVNCAGDGRDCIPQPGGVLGNNLDAIGDGRLMYRLPYRNFGSRDSLLIQHTMDADGDDTTAGVLQAAPRWMELRGYAAGTPAIYQQGTYAPDVRHRWMGSIAMDKAGNIALGYSLAHPTEPMPNGTYASVAYTTRVEADALGTLPGGEVVLEAGAGRQTHAASRWGDYSTMSVDPSNDCTFWYTQEYYTATSSATWATRVSAMTMPGCVNLIFKDPFEDGNPNAWSVVVP